MKPIQRVSIPSALLLMMLLPLAADAQTPSCDGTVYNCFMLRADSADVPTILSAHVLAEVGVVRPGEPALKLVTGPTNVAPETTLANLAGDALVLGVEMIEATVLTEGDHGLAPTAARRRPTSPPHCGTAT